MGALGVGVWLVRLGRAVTFRASSGVTTSSACYDPPFVERTPVENSASIRAIGYDPAAQALEIEFRTGPVYRYAGVSEFLYRGLLAARSKGRFFHSRIANRFPYEEVR
jgi:hypothetical protein